MKYKKTILAPGETVRMNAYQRQVEADATIIHQVIRQNPGIPSKMAIALKAGLTLGRVADIIWRIQRGKTGLMPIAYGEVRAYGERRVGWYSADLNEHHAVLDDADERAARVERGVHRYRLELLRGAAHRVPRMDPQIIASMEARLGVTRAELNKEDQEAFDELLIEAADAA